MSSLGDILCFSLYFKGPKGRLYSFLVWATLEMCCYGIMTVKSDSTNQRAVSYWPGPMRDESGPVWCAACSQQASSGVQAGDAIPDSGRKVRRTTPEVKKYSSTSCSSLFSPVHSITGPSYLISRYKDIWCLRWNSGHHYISDEFQHALDNMKEKSIYTFLLKSWKLSLLYLKVPRKLKIYVQYLSF